MKTDKINNIEFEGIVHNQYPRFEDAFIVAAEQDGKPLTEKEIDELNDSDEHADFKYMQLMKFLY